MKHAMIIAAIAGLGISAWIITGRSPTPPATAPTAEDDPAGVGIILHTNREAEEVFRRAFWREPAPDDLILHAERSEWVSESDGVRSWQWFLAVKPGKELHAWLFDANPFGLTRSDSEPVSASHAGAPAWFPASFSSGTEFHRNPDGTLWIAYDRHRNLLHSTDAGHGFATRRSP